jgi:cephalosporin hydroxylase
MRLKLTPSEHWVDLPDAMHELAEEYRSEMMDSGELLHLAGTLALYPWSSEAIVVEIGAYVGRTTVFMAKALQLLGKQAPILSIDPFERAVPDELNPQGIYSAYLKNTQLHGVENTCLPLIAFSEQAAPVVPEKIGVLIVDSAHHYPAVRKDLELYAPKMLPGGLIFIDDYIPAYPGVMRAVEEYFVPGRPFDILHKTYFVVAQHYA